MITTTIRSTEIRANADDAYAPHALLGRVETVRTDIGAVRFVAYGLDYSDHTTDSPAEVHLVETAHRATAERRIICRYRVWAARQG